MQKEDNKSKIEAINLQRLVDGAVEFNKLILSMKDQFKSPKKAVVFISGMVGYSCQAALFAQKKSHYFVNTIINKKYVFGDYLNYCLFEGKLSFYNLLMGQICQRYPELIPLKIEPYLQRVAGNIGNKDYLIQGVFNPEKIFDFQFYRSIWNKFYDTLIKYCKTPDEWPTLFSIALNRFMDLIEKQFGTHYYIYFVAIAFENAIYVSKISQLY